MTIYGVTLLSGGLDSTTVATLAKEEVDDLQAISNNLPLWSDT